MAERRPARIARAVKPRRARDDLRPAPGGAGADRAAVALWATLILLAVVRAALGFVPGMLGWGLNLQRFLSPAWAWAPWALAALGLVPALARRAVPLAARLGDDAARGRAVTVFGLVTGAALLALLLPDRVRFVGDFLLRQGAIEAGAPPRVLFPQALPLDLLLHADLPAWLAAGTSLDPNGAGRLIGAIEAGALAALALAFARALELRGTAALAAAAAVFFGGYLGLFTGYSKASGELVLVTVAAGALALRAARDGRGLVGLGLVLALGAFLHRSVVGHVPVVVLAFALALRARPAARRERATWLAAALPAVAFAFSLGRMLTTFARIDSGVHLAPAQVRLHGGILGSVLAGARGVDLVNVVVLLAPLAPALPVLALALGRGLPRGRPAALLATLAVPFLGLLLFVHPGQGAFRDYDTLSEGGVALAMLAAWLVGETLRRAPAFAWLGVAVALAAAAPSVQWLAHQTDVERGLARVHAFLAGPPARDAEERGKTWDYVGSRDFQLGRMAAAADAFAHAAETQPSPRVLLQWAFAEAQRGRPGTARVILRRAFARDSTDRPIWKGLFQVCLQLGDLEEARRVLEAVVRREPGDGYARAALRRVEWIERRGRAAPPSGAAGDGVAPSPDSLPRRDLPARFATPSSGAVPRAVPGSAAGRNP